MAGYLDAVQQAEQKLRGIHGWGAINAEYMVRMQLQNRFKTGLDIAAYTADIMRADMEAYDKDSANYTQSLGCWHGFTAQQMMMAVKRYQGTKRNYVYLSGWMVAALRSKFGPLPDQSMHEKTTVPDLIEEIYKFLKQADARELRHMFVELDDAQAAGQSTSEIVSRIDNFETHVVPIIADIDAGFGNEEATYLLAKKMIEAGACCIQLENQVSDARSSVATRTGKVTVPHEDFLSKINAVRYAFLELGIDNGVIVARTDSLGAGLTQKVPVSKTPGDLASKYNDFLECDHIDDLDELHDGDITIHQNGQLMRPHRLDNGLYAFKEGTGFDRVVLDCVTSLDNGADLLWIETKKPNVAQIAGMVNEVRKSHPDAKLVYNNSPSFNWTLAFREQVYAEWQEQGKDLSAYPDPAKVDKGLMAAELDDSELAKAADAYIQRFQQDAAREAGIFHHLITLPTYHETALGTDILSEGYFGELGMLAYVRDIQRQEIRRDQASVKHQDLAGSNIGDDHKEYFAGEKALLARGEDNTMNQF